MVLWYMCAEAAGANVMVRDLDLVGQAVARVFSCWPWRLAAGGQTHFSFLSFELVSHSSHSSEGGAVAKAAVVVFVFVVVGKPVASFDASESSGATEGFGSSAHEGGEHHPSFFFFLEARQAAQERPLAIQVEESDADRAVELKECTSGPCTHQDAPNGVPKRVAACPLDGPNQRSPTLENGAKHSILRWT